MTICVFVLNSYLCVNTCYNLIIFNDYDFTLTNTKMAKMSYLKTKGCQNVLGQIVRGQKVRWSYSFKSDPLDELHVDLDVLVDVPKHSEPF